MKDSFRPIRRLLVCAAALTGAIALGSGCSEDPPVCETTDEYFANKVWPVVSSKCQSCHSADGLARETSYVLQGAAEAGFLEHNLGVLSNLAGFEKDGKSLLLLKPTLQINHKGGAVIAEGSHEYNVLQGLVDKLKTGDTCVSEAGDPFTGVALLDAPATLRKAAVVLIGRLPTAEEVSRVEAGGFAELDVVLDEMMTETAFYEHIKTVYNDFFTTDFYLGNNAAGQLGDNYADPTWFDEETAEVAAIVAKYGFEDANELENYTNWGIAREPVELIAHVVRNDRPFTEVLTADYMMVTPLSAKSYGASAEFKAESDPLEFVEGRIDGIPHAGFLTSPMFLSRHTTTDTNRNRHRALVTIKAFLGTDILKTGEQAVDQALVTDFNPTRNNPACTVCHATIDPMAGAFMAFGSTGGYNPDAEWHEEMWEPGWRNAKLPEGQFATGLQWLAKQMAADPAFALGAVYMMYTGLTGRERLVAPSDFSDPSYSHRFTSFLTQSGVLSSVAQKFTESNFDLKVVVKELVRTPYFRAHNGPELDAAQELRLAEVGMGRLLTPEQLDRKIAAVLGMQWLDGNADPFLNFEVDDPGRAGDYQLFYGGHDSDSTTKRINEPGGLLAAVADRMAIQMACRAAPQDFARPIDQRLLFPAADVGGELYDPQLLAPETDVGITVEPIVAAIKTNIVHLHERMLGETLSVEDPEIEHSYQVFLAAWRDGHAAMNLPEPEVGEQLPYSCRATNDPVTGEEYAENDAVVDDDQFVIRAWMATITYLLSDYRFLYE